MAGPFRSSHFAGPSLGLRSLERAAHDRTAGDVAREQRRRWIRRLTFWGSLVPLPLLVVAYQVPWPGSVQIGLFGATVLLPMFLLSWRGHHFLLWLKEPASLDPRIAPPPLGQETIITWDHAGVRHILEPQGLTVDGRLVAPAADGFDSLLLEIQQHPSTGEQLHLVAATTRPRVEIRWQGALPPGEDGVRVASYLLRDARVRDETFARALEPYTVVQGLKEMSSGRFRVI